MNPRLSVLVVDDEGMIRDLFKRLCSLLGVEATAAESGARAVELVQSRGFDLIFLDVRMPGMNGLEAYRAIRPRLPGAVVVMMTGYEVEDILKTARHEGVREVLRKPFDVECLRAIIEEAKRRKQLPGSGA